MGGTAALAPRDDAFVGDVLACPGPTGDITSKAASSTAVQCPDPPMIVFSNPRTGRLAAHLRYIQVMKTATIPSVRVEPDFRAEVEAVLADGETLSEFVEASVRASVERRRIQAEFVARGLRSRDEARRTGDYVDADVVLEVLQRKLDAARVCLATKGK